MNHYFITNGDQPEQEVSVYVYTATERAAGFHGPGHLKTPPEPATAAFSSRNKDGHVIKGRVEYAIPTDPS